MERKTEKDVIKYDDEIREAIRKWDEFIAPIREFYGVPRYRPKVKKDGEHVELWKNQTRGRCQW